MTIPFEPSAIDRHFAAFIQREAKGGPPWLELVVALASNAVGCGNICLNLADIAEGDVLVDGTRQQLPSTGELREQLAGAAVVGAPGQFRPLVLDGAGRLYLYRYWRYEHDLARVILEKTGLFANDFDESLLGEGVERLFPDSAGEGGDWQKIAAMAAVRKRFCVISGGPGTGKTSTVVKIIALLLEQARGKSLRIALAAPTGKAAARLKESIRLMKEKLDCAPDVKALIPDEVTTIHRLLGVRAGSVRFRHSGDNLLPHDVVIVDEASMVALPLMAKLAVALREDARLVLLGDRDQLASVEAGAALGDICGGGRSEPFSAGFAAFVQRVAGEKVHGELSSDAACPLADSLVILKKNYRFGADSGIGAVAGAVNAGDGANALVLLRRDSGGCSWHDIPLPDRLKKAMAERIVNGYGAYLAASSPSEALERFDRFRILCALRQGAYGVAGINGLVEEILAEKGLIERHNRWYAGRPVMVTVNDYQMKLFNGDIGIVLPDKENNGEPRVWFSAPDGAIRKVSPVRLPMHETVFAMTVHKSQGSEFDQVLMLLPDRDSGALTRELIYTGITRAKNEVEIWGDEAVFVGAVSKRIDRKSGLKDALWPETESSPG